MAEEDDRHRLFSFLEDRFGIPEELFDDYVLFERKKSWSIMKSSALFASAAQLKVSRVGLKAFHKVGAFIKPTTRIIQMFGHAATKARLEIDGNQLQCLVSNQDLPMELNLEKGYVILSLDRDIILGLGFYGHGKVKSQIPRKELRKKMVDIT